MAEDIDTSTEAVEWLANKCEATGMRSGAEAAATLRALAAERDRLATEVAKLREALKEIARLGSLVAHDLTGRVEGGKVAAVQLMPHEARAALAGDTR
jgi:hypothetical protein